MPSLSKNIVAIVFEPEGEKLVSSNSCVSYPLYRNIPRLPEDHRYPLASCIECRVKGKTSCSDRYNGMALICAMESVFSALNSISEKEENEVINKTRGRISSANLLEVRYLGTEYISAVLFFNMLI